MFKLKLIHGDNPKLKTACKVTDMNRARQVGLSIVIWLKTHPALGMAANQFGIMERVCVAKIRGELRIFIDPKITFKFGSQVSKQEGCLTWPNRRGDIVRPTEVEVEFLTPQLVVTRESFFNLEAIIMEHEVDHLDGIRCVDKFLK